ncbi:MAG TPA: dihydrodipicolinate synthase family protein, partial [Acidobacteriaceae bacterium]
AKWMIDSGCTGVILLGSLGEAATLNPVEKKTILQTVREALPAGVPVVAAISGLSTAENVELAKTAADAGCDGLMVLPPYVYRGDWREMRSHISAILKASSLPCMLYNNPVAYGTDFTPEQIVELTHDHANLQAVKESSTDVRRITAIRTLLNDRLSIFVGVDDLILEGIAAGAKGWVAGLVNAFPIESVRLFELGAAGEWQAAFELYRWFLPLLRLDTMPKFIQFIKLVEKRVGVGSERVRPPRLEISGQERKEILQLVDEALATRPVLEVSPTL